jgi:hypothetical protein
VDEKLPSYKYKFKQIFKKIGQAKALDLFYFVAVLTWTVKVKNKHYIDYHGAPGQLPNVSMG